LVGENLPSVTWTEITGISRAKWSATMKPRRSHIGGNPMVAKLELVLLSIVDMIY
jgi:hypothetical protein